MREPGAFDFDSACVEIAESIEVGSHAERLLNLLCGEVGPRPAGSMAMRLAAGMLVKEWLEFGATDVHTEEVPVLCWEEGEATAELVRPFRRRYECVQCLNSGSGAVEGRLLNAGTSTGEACLAPTEDIRGAILLVKGHEISGGKFEPLEKRITLAQQAGAAGVLLASSHPDLPCLEVLPLGVAVPVVSVSGKDGQELAAFSNDSEARLRVETRGKPSSAACVNLVGEIGAEREAEEVILLGAHLDSLHVAPGAFDNLTGVVTLTEVARSLAPFRDHFRRILRIVAFTGEELGFLGSKEYVRAHADELCQIRFVLNLDSLFDSTAQGIAVMWAPRMREYIQSALRGMHPEVEARNHFCMSSDYLPFMLEGIAAGRPADWRNSFPIWSHTVEDTADKIPVGWLGANAVVFARLLLKMLTDGRPLPSRRKSREEMLALIEEEGVREHLRWQGWEL